MPGHVQSACDAPNSGESEALAFGAPLSADNLVVVAVWWADPVLNVTSVTDMQGNDYVAVSPPVRHTGPGYAYANQLWYASRAAGGPNTVTVTFSGAAVLSGLFLHEYGGFGGPAVLDVAVSARGAGTAPGSGVAVTTSAPALIFGFATSAGGVSAPGAGFTSRQTCNGDMTEDKVALAPGPYTADFAAGDAGWVAIMAAFKAAIDGGSDGGYDPGGDAGADAGRHAVRGPLTVGCGCSSQAGAWGLAALAAAVVLARAASSTHRRR